MELYFQIRLEAQRDQAQSKAGRDTGAIPKRRFFWWSWPVENEKLVQI